jgi:hypothetical protein
MSEQATAPEEARPIECKPIEDHEVSDFFSGYSGWETVDDIAGEFGEVARRIAAHLDGRAVETVIDDLHDDLEYKIECAISHAVEDAIVALANLED